jgi:splicing factor U2AF subunit
VTAAAAAAADSVAAGIAPNPTTRFARRAYVGGIRADVAESALWDFFERAMATADATDQPGGCVEKIYVNRDKAFAFVEFKTVEEASNAMALDGVAFGDAGDVLRVRRPNDYDAGRAVGLGPTAPRPDLNLAALGLARLGSDGTRDDPWRIYVGGLPAYVEVAHLRELASSFGEVRACNLVMDKDTGACKGYGFFEYVDDAVAEAAVAGLDGVRMGDRFLKAKFANGVGGTRTRQAAAPGVAVPSGVAAPLASGSAPLASGSAPSAPQSSAPLPASGSAPTRCVLLRGVVTRDELRDPREAADVREETEEVCRGYGTLERMEMPVPAPEPLPDPPGVGEVLLVFADVAAAARARANLDGRTFADRVVSAEFVHEDEFEQRRGGDEDARTR